MEKAHSMQEQTDSVERWIRKNQKEMLESLAWLWWEKMMGRKEGEKPENPQLAKASGVMRQSAS